MRLFHPVPYLLSAVLLIGCSAITHETPRPGQALLDLTPEKEKMKRVGSVRLVSVNKAAAGGTVAHLRPGPNTAKIRFSWPHDPSQEVDLRFRATPGRTYVVQYEAFPPYVNRFSQGVALDRAAHDILKEGGEAIIVTAPISLALESAAIAHRGGAELAERRKPVQYLDLQVVAHHSLEGVVERLRLFPDGRIVRRP